MKITVIGAGNSGLAMSAHLSYCGNEVCLWNRSERTIAKLMNTRAINVDGIINDSVKIHNVTTNMNDALRDTELILLTTPASSYYDLAKLLAAKMTKRVPIILNPGRTFGALNFYEIYRGCGGILDPIIAETQTIIYTCRKNAEDNVSIYTLKKVVKLASLKKSEEQIFFDIMPQCIKMHYILGNSFLETSLGNVGMVLHCIPFMLNTGWTECIAAEYKYYYDGITPTIGRFIQHIDDERVAVGAALGIKLETTMEWMKREYATKGTTLYDCIQNNKAYKEIDAPKSVFHRYIFEDVPYGLVPFERLGNELGIDTRYITVAIDLANALVEEDFRAYMQNINLEIVKTFLKM